MPIHLRCQFLDVIADTVDGKTIRYERYLILWPDSLAGQTFVLTLDPNSNIPQGEINGTPLRVVGISDEDSHVSTVG